MALSVFGVVLLFGLLSSNSAHVLVLHCQLVGELGSQCSLCVAWVRFLREMDAVEAMVISLFQVDRCCFWATQSLCLALQHL